MLSHGNIGYDVTWMVGADEMGPDDLRLSQVPLHYISPHLFQPPVAGSRVHLLTDEENMFPDRVAAAMERERVTVWAAAATALRLLLESGALAGRRLPQLRLVKSHGEPLPLPVLRAATAALPQVRFTTTYGATEAPDIAHYTVPKTLPDELGALPLGAVQPGYRALICDEAGKELPRGEIGEICCIGEGVCLGYWRDAALTEAKRLPGRPGSYRTGDLGFLDRSGALHFAGRKTQLVKLRGHRFDLGEIEATLKRHPAVREAVVVTPSDEGADALAAVVEADADAGLVAALLELCAERLPRFAWPARIHVAARFPRLPNGKIDRQRLRALAEAAQVAGNAAI
jgi:acyl-coenzyme A synthetase/AMP-(fatty) acid ligase